MPISAAQAASSGTAMQVDPPQGANPRSLAELEARLARDLELLLIPPAKEWLQPTAHPRWGRLLDVAIIGAGMGGLATAFALKRLGVRNMRLFDRAPEGFEGPWVSYARMQTLRSPPELVGPALGLANLTFRAWFEAQFGIAAWPTVHRISRLQWMAYLRWYRRMLAVPIENEVEIIDIAGDATAVCLQLRSAVGNGELRRVAWCWRPEEMAWAAHLYRRFFVPSTAPIGPIPATISTLPRCAARP